MEHFHLNHRKNPTEELPKELSDAAILAQQAWHEPSDSIVEAFKEENHDALISDAQKNDWVDIAKDEYHGDALKKAQIQLLKRLEQVSKILDFDQPRIESETDRIMKSNKPSEISALSKEYKQYEIKSRLKQQGLEIVE